MNIVQPAYPAWNGSPAYRALSSVTDLIIHHGDDSLDTTPLEIDAQHRAQGWDGIGYHFVIPGDGTIYRGRPLDMVPSAALGDNYASVDVCLCGDFQPGTDGYDGSPTAAQLQSLKDLAVYLHSPAAGLALVRTIGHRDVSYMVGCPNDATACPGDTLYAMLPELRAFVEAHK